MREAAWNRASALRPLIGVVFVAMLALHYGRASRPLMDHVEYAGIIPKLEALAGTVGDEDLLIVESRNAEGDIHVLGLPLAYVYARNVLVLNSPRPGKPGFAAFLEWARTRYRRVLFIGGGGTDLLSHRYGVQAIASERFQVPEYDSPLNAYPRFVRQKEFDYGLYAFTPPQPADTGGFDLDVGDPRRPARAPVPREGKDRGTHVPVDSCDVVRVGDRHPAVEP